MINSIAKQINDFLSAQKANFFLIYANTMVTDFFSKAIKYYDKAAIICPNNADIYRLKGVAFMQKKKYFKAIQQFKKAIELENHYFDYALVGDCFLLDNKDEEAIEFYTESIRLKPNCFKSLTSLATTLYDIGKYAEALEVCNRIIRRKKYIPNSEIGKIKTLSLEKLGYLDDIAPSDIRSDFDFMVILDKFIMWLEVVKDCAILFLKRELAFITIIITVLFCIYKFLFK